MHVVKNEHADKLGFRDPHPRKVEWFTDQYGFRNRPRVTEPARYDIVVVGDSNIVGSSHDQKDTIAEVLERKCNCAVYSYGGASKRQFFNDLRFRKNPPRVIVVEAIGAEFYRRSLAEPNYAICSTGREPCKVSLPDSIGRLARPHAQDQHARIRSQPPECPAIRPETTKPRRRRPSVSPFVVDIVTKMRDEATRRGSDFIFVLMPYDSTLDQAVIKLKELGVKTIAYLPTIRNVRRRPI